MKVTMNEGLEQNSEFDAWVEIEEETRVDRNREKNIPKGDNGFQSPIWDVSSVWRIGSLLGGSG